MKAYYHITLQSIDLCLHCYAHCQCSLVKVFPTDSQKFLAHSSELECWAIDVICCNMRGKKDVASPPAAQSAFFLPLRKNGA